MKALLLAGGLSLLISLLGTPLFIRFLVKRQYGQFIRQDGPTAHFTKRGTPTMGGLVIITATVLGWAGGLLITGERPTASAGLVLFLARGIVQATLYGHDATGWLAFARVAMGYPLYIAAVGFALLIVRRARRQITR